MQAVDIVRQAPLIPRVADYHTAKIRSAVVPIQAGHEASNRRENEWFMHTVVVWIMSLDSWI